MPIESALFYIKIVMKKIVKAKKKIKRQQKAGKTKVKLVTTLLVDL